MPRGGARPGAGRPKGSAGKSSAALRERALASGDETPLDYMLRVMHDTRISKKRRDDMAKAAAPYLHSRLQAVQHSGADGGNVVFEVVRYADKAPPTK